MVIRSTDRSAVVLSVAFWIIGPSIATGMSYVTFLVLPGV